MFRQDNVPSHAGDICFYNTSHSLIDDLIVARTGSPVVHVAVYVGDGHTIAAVTGGISRQNIGNEAHVWYPQGDYNLARLNVAILWLNQQVGLPYGYADIANMVFTLLGKNPVLLDKSADCSDLAAKFLWIAGVELPANLIETHTISPGGLYSTLSNVA